MPTDRPQDKYLKPSDVAALCSVTSNVVNRWIRDGVRISDQLIRLRAVAFGDRFRILPSDLAAFSEECTRAKLGPDVPKDREETPTEEQRRFKADRDRAAAILGE